MDIPPPEILAAAPVPPGVAESGTPQKIYRAGTLHYTVRGLVALSIWLLWGDFAFTFFESVFGRFLPLYLKDLHASNTLIGVMTGSVAGLVNILFLPNISQWSDHTRTRFGRRIPFLYVVTPVVVASLIAIGFAPELAGWLHARVLARLAPAVSLGTVILGLLCALVVSYHFFNMVLCNAYNWLLRDVVPLELMARFLSWFRVVGTASSFAFLRWVFPHLQAHRKGVFLGVGLFYLAAFLLMCLNVKEGGLPPPPPKETRPGMVQSFALYFRECLRLPIYRNFFIASVLMSIANNCAGPFSTLFTRETLGLDMESMGKIFAWGAAGSAVAYIPMGWVCDRFTPLRVMLVGLTGVMMMAVLSYFLIQGGTSLLVMALVGVIPSIACAMAVISTTMRLFPEEKFGQFSSGLNVFGCGAFIFGNYFIGKFMDLVHSNYRMTFLWSAALYALALYPLLLVYRDWKKYGGPNDYRPPMP